MHPFVVCYNNNNNNIIIIIIIVIFIIKNNTEHVQNCMWAAMRNH